MVLFEVELEDITALPGRVWRGVKRLPRTLIDRAGLHSRLRAVAIGRTIGARHRRGQMGLPIQIILTRQLAGYLSVPLFLVDPKGDLLFYNEPAEAILGRRFDETGAMPAAVWSAMLPALDDRGQPIPSADRPLMITLTQHRPVYKRFFLQGMNGVRRQIEVAAIPIVGLQGEFLGAAALFWEIK
jgi:PAS domain-containing protein